MNALDTNRINVNSPYKVWAVGQYLSHLYINGTPHGKTERGATTCQLYMRRFNDGDEAMDCASCIGCGACVAACKNGHLWRSLCMLSMGAMAPLTSYLSFQRGNL